MLKLKVTSINNNQKVGKFVKKLLNEAPLSFIYKIFRKKDVKVNGHWAKDDLILHEGDTVCIYVSEEQLSSFHQQKSLIKKHLSYPIVYEDQHILIINKTAGVLVVKDDKDNDKTLSSEVLSYLYYKDEYDPSFSTFIPSPSHRLDRNTSGLVLFGKDDESLKELTRLFRERDGIEKYYQALCVGEFKGSGVIEKPLLKDSRTGIVKVSSSVEAKNAKTTYKTLVNYQGFTLVECHLITGRTHQIRVHLASINHPIVGDAKYGDFKVNKSVSFPHQFLHAYKIKFANPSGVLSYLKGKTFECPFSSEEREFLVSLNKK